MEHDEVKASIPALAAGRLDPATQRVVEAHLGDCASCAAAASTAAALAHAFARDGAELFEPHPDAESLRRHAAAARLADPVLARHVASCASCALEVEGWRARSTAERPRRPRWSRREIRFAAAGLAAGLLLGAIVGLATRGPREPSGVTGAVPRVLVQHAVRGLEGAPELTLSAFSARGLVDASFELPQGTAPNARVRFEIRDAAGGVVWTAIERAGDVAAELARHELIGFLVPAGALAEGEHRFEVSIEGSAGPALLAASFRVHHARAAS